MVSSDREESRANQAAAMLAGSSAAAVREIEKTGMTVKF
jgi:hypothetical protein